MTPEVRKAPTSGEFFIINERNSYELIDSYGNDPLSCLFRPVHTERVLADNSIKPVSVNKVEPFVKQGFILFIFEDM